MTGTNRMPRRKNYAIATVVATALISGGALLSAPIASAAEASKSATPSLVSVNSDPASTTKETTKPRQLHVRGAALTGTVAAQVKAAALAKYPGATVRRLDTDRHGVYEAHIVTTDGQRVTVKVSKTFTVISTHVTSTHVSHHKKVAATAPKA
jgi:hypothetical protein